MDHVLASGRHFSGMHTRMLLSYVAERLGDSGVAQLLEKAGETRPVEELLDDTSWSSYGQLRPLLEAAAALLAGIGGLRGIAEVSSFGSSTAPQIGSTLQSLGSPLKMLVAGAEAARAISTVSTLEPEIVSPTHVRWHHRLIDGFEPFPELCAFYEGLSPLMLRLFGMRVLEVSQAQCQSLGAEECVTDLRWEEADDPSLQLDAERARREIAESRLEAFEQTVHDIVSVDSLDAVLGRIVANAARAMHSPGFALVVDTLPGRVRFYTDGISEEMVKSLLEDDAGAWLSAEVASAHRRYGQLLALDPGISSDHDRASLDAYARLAATALDSAFALEDARRQARSAEALLDLSTSLADLSSVQDLAAKVAKAIPDVIDCDCAAVLLVEDGVARVVAHSGYPPDVGAQIEALEIPIVSRDRQEVHRRSREEVSPLAQGLMKDAGLRTMASAPLRLDGATVGILVAALRDESEHVLDDPDLAERFAGLAGQATVALQNSRLLEQIRHQSLHDPLTDLPNRVLLLDRAEQMLVRARRDQTRAAALFIDLDGFKQVNDTLGHGCGDELLQKVAVRLIAALRANDTVGRIGGDEFVVLTEGTAPDAGFDAVAEKVLDALQQPFELTGRERPVTIGASIGVAVGDRPCAGDLLRDADIALYHAKAAGKGCHRVFAAEMQEEAVARAQLGERLAEAIAHEELFLVYQPMFDLDTEVATGVEALLRWAHPDFGIVAPDMFIPSLEETGLIVEVGRWVLQEACMQASRLRSAGHPIDMAVNTSMRQFERPDFIDDVRDALEASGIPPSSLIIEMTETAIMHDADATLVVLDELKNLGVRIAIDDFGTGYSSLAYLRQFPVDSLKIDRSFIGGGVDSRGAGEMVHTLVALGNSLQLETLAEGIEHPAQLQHLRQEGCDSGQGYLLSRPLSAEHLAIFLDEHARSITRGGRSPAAIVRSA